MTAQTRHLVGRLSVIDLPDWDLDAGNYYVSVFGTNGNYLGWGFGSTPGDDVATHNGVVGATNLYVGFQLSGDGA
jgi:hypothetical protein